MPANRQKATIVTDLGFGDAGKGSIVDYLARTEGATYVVRFNGGPQAGHSVVLDDGRQHTFHQFGSASFVPGVRTHLSRFMLVSPLHLWNEAKELEAKGVPKPNCLVTIDKAAKVITPYHEAANRIRELLRGKDRHGSCGFGVGETMGDSLDYPDDTLYVADLPRETTALRKLEATRLRKLAEFSGQRDAVIEAGGLPYLENLGDELLSQAVVDFYGVFIGNFAIVPDNYLPWILDDGPVIFEGAQGVLLDEWYGFHPYTTWSTTTNANADTLLAEAGFAGEVTRLGLLRAYATRHGAGPFPTEDPQLTKQLADRNNPRNPWQEGFRVGYFDAVLARYALDIAGPVDGLVVSCLDQLDGIGNWSVCDSYLDEAGQAIERLTRSMQPDLDFQARLTAQLFSYQPHLTRVTGTPFCRHDADGYIRRIEALLGVPVVLTSSGPTAKDKTPQN